MLIILVWYITISVSSESYHFRFFLYDVIQTIYLLYVICHKTENLINIDPGKFSRSLYKLIKEISINNLAETHRGSSCLIGIRVRVDLVPFFFKFVILSLLSAVEITYAWNFSITESNLPPTRYATYISCFRVTLLHILWSYILHVFNHVIEFLRNPRYHEKVYNCVLRLLPEYEMDCVNLWTLSHWYSAYRNSQKGGSWLCECGVERI